MEYKLDLTQYFSDKVLVILDVSSITEEFYNSGNQKYGGYRPYFSFNYLNKNHNSTGLYRTFGYLVNALYNLENVDFLASFSTNKYALKKILPLELPEILESPYEYTKQENIQRKALRDANITILEKDGFESYSLIYKAVKDNLAYYDKIIIVSAEKTLYSLVSDQVSFIIPSNKYDLNLEVFEDIFGVTPDYFNMMLAVVGDTSLGIKGVKGVGKKTFLKMVEKTMIPEQILELLKANTKLKDDDFLSLDSVLNWLQPQDIGFLDTKAKPINKRELKNYLEIFECKKYIEKLDFYF